LDLTWSPNDRYLAILSGHPKRGLYILDAENGFQEVTHFEYSQDITSLAWINENEIIITTDQDNLILIQDIKKENPEKFPADSDYRNVFYAVGFNYIFVSNGSTIFTLDLKSFERIHQFPCKISQHFNVPARRPILGCECDSNKSLCFVDIQTGKVIKKKEFPVTTMRSAKWTNDGHYFAYLSNNGFVLIDYLNNHVVWRPTFESFPLSMSWSPDGKYIATGHGYGEIRIWDIEKIIQVSGE
jgi:WD40 repeat protein